MNANNLTGMTEYTGMIKTDRKKPVQKEPEKKSLFNKVLNMIGLEIDCRDNKRSFSDFNSDGTLKDKN